MRRCCRSTNVAAICDACYLSALQCVNCSPTQRCLCRAVMASEEAAEEQACSSPCGMSGLGRCTNTECNGCRDLPNGQEPADFTVYFQY